MSEIETQYFSTVINDNLNFVYFFRALKEAFEGIFPKDNPKSTRFSINFFTSIGLGGLT